VFLIGDVIEQRPGQKVLLAGHYKVMNLSADTAQLSRLHRAGEDAIEARLNNTIFLPIALLDMFNIVTAREEQQP
jgi:hypothetical protein